MKLEYELESNSFGGVYGENSGDLSLGGLKLRIF